jgi:hypothetical protein
MPVFRVLATQHSCTFRQLILDNILTSEILAHRAEFRCNPIVVFFPLHDALAYARLLRQVYIYPLSSNPESNSAPTLAALFPVLGEELLEHRGKLH